jgi:hypothetical protein
MTRKCCYTTHFRRVDAIRGPNATRIAAIASAVTRCAPLAAAAFVCMNTTEVSQDDMRYCAFAV